MLKLNHSFITSSIFLLLMFFISAVNAAPLIGIGSMYDVLTPGTQSLTKRIYNTGDTTAFVRVELLEISPNQKNNTTDEKPVNEITGNTLERDRLIVTPLRMIIPPNGFQSTRIFWPGTRDKERYFRVRFIPALPESGDDFGLNHQEADKYRTDTLQAGVNILTGYGTIVIVHPDSPTFNTHIDKTRYGDITVTNDGNATIVLENIRQCRTANTDCGDVTREFILPGRSHFIAGKAGFKTNFTLIEGEEKQAQSN